MNRKHPLAECERCPLQSKKCVPSKTPQGAKVALVSRSPGYYDSAKGGPFSGPSGKVVDHLLDLYGHKRSETIVANVVMCESDNPPATAIAACRNRLLDEVSKVDTIIAAGTEAVAAFTKYRTTTSARGFVHYRTVTDCHGNERTQRVVATNNPALVLRDNDVYPDLVTDFKIALDPLPEPEFPEVEIVRDTRQVRDYIKRWETGHDPLVSTDLEWSDKRIECAGFSFDGRTAVVFSGDAIEQGTIGRKALTDFYGFDNIRSSFLYHNGKSDTTRLRQDGINGRVNHDTFLLSRLLDEEPGRHQLEYLLQVNFGWPDYEPESVKRFKKDGLGDLTFYGDDRDSIERARNELYTYNGWDTAGTYQLFQKYSEEVKSQGLWERPYLDLMVPTHNAIRAIEMRGFYFDPEEACNINEREVYPRLAEWKAELRRITGHALLNPASPQQMAAVYYDDFGLMHKLKDSGKKKFSTSTGKEVRKEIMEGRVQAFAGKLNALNEVAKLHQRYSKVNKQRGNYLEGLTIRCNAEGKLHCTFMVPGTITSRATSKDPNFQNITREGVEGIPGIRTIFLPSPGNVLIQADFSQAELRTCAVLSGDDNLSAIYYDSSRSLHKERAAAFYGKDYTKEQYVWSKNINFGVTYGQSPQAFAQMYAMPLNEAEEYCEAWWRQFPQLKQWTQDVWDVGRTQGFVQSPFGFKRRINLIPEDANGLRRELVNFLPQNVAAWFTFAAICDLVDIGVPIISTVHDSIIADVPKEQAMFVAKTMKNVMERQPMQRLGWDMPFVVDVSIGDTWGSCKEVELEDIAA